MTSEIQQLAAGIAALEAQRALLGDAVVEMAAAPLRARLEAARSQQTAPAAEAPQQLKQVSVLFIDVVGSTAMAQRLDPEDIHAVMDSALARFTTLVQQHQGQVLQYTGDGMLAAFGADAAHEDDPESAIRAALEIVAAAKEIAAQVQRDHQVGSFNVRAGINTGSVLLGGGVDAEGTIRGTTVNIAARMEQSAPPGGLRISHDTYRHVRGVFNVTKEPPLLVKGSDEPMVTYLVHGTKPRAFRVVTRGIEGVETRMVARDAELEQLQDAFRSLYRSARPIAIDVVAEAGIGKSRLLYEFENWAEAQPETFYYFRGRAHPQTQTEPYGLLRDVLAWRLQISDGDDAETARKKLVDGVMPLFREDKAEGEANAHLLGQLLGLDFSASPHVRGIGDDARQIRNRGFHAAAQVLRRTAALNDSPIMLLLDDLHWADDGSLDFVDYLVQVNADVSMLMLCMTRPTLFERRPDWGSIESAWSRIDLQPLDKRGSRELANVLLQRLDSIPVALRELITGGAEGNPFYMEELVKMLVDDGAILTGSEAWQVVPDKLLAAHVPPTLTGVLQARLDSLSADEKLALQQASVIGFVFWDQALAALDANSARSLGTQVQRGLVVPREHAAFEGQKEYAFKHQILHQVTYDSLLKRHRREYHARAAAWLAHMSRDRAAESLGLAAEHYERAGDRANACSFFTRAAENAAARYANETMLGYVERALALAEPDDHTTRWRLLLVRESFLLFQNDRAAHAADLDALSLHAEALDDDARRAEVALRRASAHNSAGDHAAGERAAREGLALAYPLESATMAVPLHSILSASLIGRGDYAQARQTAEAGLALARAREDRAGESSLINVLGLIAMEQGELTVAAEHFELTLSIEREIGNRAREGLRLNNLGSVYPRLGDYAKARRHLDDGLRVARAIGRRNVEAGVLLNTASVAHLQGDDSTALTYARAAFDVALASGQKDIEAYARLVAGHAELGLGRLAAAGVAYADSRDRLQLLKMRSQQVLDPVSGLARVALAQGAVDEAVAQMETVHAHIAAGGSLDGTEEPLLIPLTCYQVFAAAGDPRAASVLANAHSELLAQAARIADLQARRGFLHNVPHHREIVAAWERQQASLPERRKSARL